MPFELRVDNSHAPVRHACSRCLQGIGRERRPCANLRAKREQRDLIDQAAAMLAEKRSDFMREAAGDRAQSVLLDPAVFRLDDRRFKDFIRQFDAPPAAPGGR